MHAEASSELAAKRKKPSSPKRRLWLDLKRDKYLYLIALPGLLYFLVFKYLPIGGLLVAFQNYSPYFGIWKSEWVGLEHFQRFFSNEDFYLLFRNTMAINLLNLTFFFPFPIILSLLLNELRSVLYKRLVQTIIYIPHFLSWVIIAGLTFLMLSESEGLINKLMAAMGMKTVSFLTEPNYFWAMLTAQSMWKEAGGDDHLPGGYRRCRSPAIRSGRNGRGQPFSPDVAYYAAGDSQCGSHPVYPQARLDYGYRLRAGLSDDERGRFPCGGRLRYLRIPNRDQAGRIQLQHGHRPI